MSKYDPLWRYLRDNVNSSVRLTFDEIKDIAGIPIDHSFLKYKSELEDFGFKVGKISMKDKTVSFEKLG